jgi:hypothetical protein
MKTKKQPDARLERDKHTALREGITTLREYVREADCGHGGLCQIGNIEKQLADLLAAHTPEPT